MLIAAESDSVRVEIELTKNMDIFSDIDVDSIIRNSKINSKIVPTETLDPVAEAGTSSATVALDNQSDDEEYSIDEIIDILNTSDQVIVISGSSNEGSGA